VTLCMLRRPRRFSTDPKRVIDPQIHFMAPHALGAFRSTMLPTGRIATLCPRGDVTSRAASYLARTAASDGFTMATPSATVDVIPHCLHAATLDVSVGDFFVHSQPDLGSDGSALLL
jgi:hypothetical protein